LTETLLQGDCMKLLSTIKSDSIDLILCDPPYGTIKGLELGNWDNTKTVWDNPLPTEPLFKEYGRILKLNGALILFSQEPYTHQLRSFKDPNLKFAYPFYWLKDSFANPLFSKKAPVNYIEDLSVWRKKYDTNLTNPLRKYAQSILDYTHKTSKDFERDFNSRCMEHFFCIKSKEFSLPTEKNYQRLCERYGLMKMRGYLDYQTMKAIHRSHFPIFNLNGEKKVSNVLQYSKPSKRYHPTQKPVELLQFLIKTYTNEGMTVLDNCMGSGSTGIAAKQLNRNFIGMELNKEYFEIAKQRIKNA
jgi:site-specific DNA-methyltransferase (adenine-specific)